MDEATVVAATRRRSVGVYGMSAYRSPDLSGPPALVLGYGGLSEQSIPAGVAALAEALPGGA